MSAPAVEILEVQRATSSSFDSASVEALGLVLAALLVGYFLLLDGPFRWCLDFPRNRGHSEAAV